jgi:repressor LexA
LIQCNKLELSSEILQFINLDGEELPGMINRDIVLNRVIEMAKKGNLFALRVIGESMKEIGINSGDIAIIQKKDTAKNGDIVVAMVEEEATLKAYFKESDHIRLEARNKAFKPIKTKKASILGKLVGLYRIY